MLWVGVVNLCCKVREVSTCQLLLISLTVSVKLASLGPWRVCLAKVSLLSASTGEVDWNTLGNILSARILGEVSW